MSRISLEKMFLHGSYVNSQIRSCCMVRCASSGRSITTLDEYQKRTSAFFVPKGAGDCADIVESVHISVVPGALGDIFITAGLEERGRRSAC